jgi:hypothetical protein
MRVGVIQSNYVPWRGYFDFIREVDVFVIHDDLQFTKGDWRNRNLLKTAQGTHWMTVPVHYRHTAQLICDTRVDYSRNWQRQHRNLIMANLGSAPYLPDVLSLIHDSFEARHETISGLNVALIKAVCRYLGIVTPIRHSSEFRLGGTKTTRLIELLTAMRATTYVSGPSARSYLDESTFREARIRLEYKRYDYPEYPQLFGKFDGRVSILDLIANCGPSARRLLTQRVANEVAVA